MMYSACCGALPVAQLSLEPVFGWWVVVPIALVMLASLWLTFSTEGGQSLPLRRRGLLVGLRLLAILVLLLGCLQPALVSQTELETPGAIAVLMDRSLSMSLPSDSPGRNRWQIQQEVWSVIESETDLSIGQMKLVPYFYDADIGAVSNEDLPDLANAFASPPAGRSTDLGAALSKLGSLQQEPPLRAAIVMGDAAQTVLTPPVDPSLAAKQMAQLDQPILFIGIGPRGEASLMKDVALDGMPEHFTAFVKKELRVPMVVSALGMQNQPIQIELRLRASGKADRVVATREVLASQPNEKLAIEFAVEVPDEGEYLLVANARVDAVDQIEQNNTLTSFVTVREGGVKILYLEGQPRAEQLYLKRSWNESLDFDVDYKWFPEKERSRWPRELGTDVQQYDAFVIGDLHAGALSASAQRAIVSRVREGAGILFLGGYQSFEAGGWGAAPLEPAFPIEMAKRRTAVDAPVDPGQHYLSDIPLRPTRPHPVTTLETEPENTRLWEQLPPLNGANRLDRLKTAPGIQVLLEGPERQPILITSELGRGRSLAFAGDTTWRWWLAGEAKLHQQFWRQAMLWLIGRESLHEGFRMLMDRRRLPLDASAQVTAEWFGGTDNKPMPQDVKIELSSGGRWLRNLDTDMLAENRLRANIGKLEQQGLYQASLTATSVEGETYRSEIAFLVRDDSRELAQPAADWQMIENIVSANSAAGGRRVLPEDIGSALDWLRQRQETARVTTLQRRRLGDAAWDAWLYLVVFCLLMAGEWGLRKAWQLP